MRRSTVIAFVVLAACKNEPGFDQRYSQAEEEIRVKARQIDSELREQMKDAGGETDKAGAKTAILHKPLPPPRMNAEVRLPSGGPS